MPQDLVASPSVAITNVVPGQTILLKFPVAVSYSNGLANDGNVALSCGGSNNPGTAAPGPSGNVSLELNHGAADRGHTLTATLTPNGLPAISVDVTNVNVSGPVGGGDAEGGNITIAATDEIVYGLPVVLTNAPLAGTFDPKWGNRVILLVLDGPKIVNGRLQQPLMTFADSAIVEAAQGKWKHAAIPNAKKGQHLQIVLTKDGVVKGLIQAIFK
jgi:hypothetical protein